MYFPERGSHLTCTRRTRSRSALGSDWAWPSSHFETHHLVVGLEAAHGELSDRVGLVRSFGGRDDGSVGGEREVDTGEGNQVGLEPVGRLGSASAALKGGVRWTNSLRSTLRDPAKRSEAVMEETTCSARGQRPACDVDATRKRSPER